MPDEGAHSRPARETFSPETVVRALARAKGQKGKSAAALASERDFAVQLLEDYAPGDLPQLTPGDLGALAFDLWTFCAAHPEPQGPQARLVDARGEGGRPLGLDLLQIVQGARPFLVDSVMGELVGHSLTI